MDPYGLVCRRFVHVYAILNALYGSGRAEVSGIIRAGGTLPTLWKGTWEMGQGRGGRRRSPGKKVSGWYRRY